MKPTSQRPSTAMLATALAVITGGHADIAPRLARAADAPIVVRNRKQIAGKTIPCRRIALGQPEDYKPSIVQLPSGELLLVVFSGERVGGGKIREITRLYRSKDLGLTWSAPELKPELLGREPYLSITRDGTLFITGHLLSQDIRNTFGFTSSFLHRSTDAGRTWTSIRLQPRSFRKGKTVLTARNVIELADGSLMIGISEHAPQSRNVFWKSTDGGKTWPERFPARFADVPANYPYTILGEAHLWQARSGRLHAILRVGSANSWPIKGTKDPGNNDQSERMLTYTSADGGHKWTFVDNLGKYGQMYPSVARVGKGRLLLTFTQRAIAAQLGVRAVLGRETRDGFRFDMAHDELLLETRTPKGKASGGGFGPTIVLKDGTLITAYTYRDAKNVKHAEVVRWQLPALP
ncbi:MAG: hypothetical protein CMJ65_05570 [Planctomycetaceae bacterium]|nr:hypothetical protein [Planctomycetaceae bacterium]